MEGTQRCPDCGAPWNDGATCEDRFHQMLAWEWEDPNLAEVHHLMVLCHHIQHPGMFSPEGLERSIGLLSEFVEEEASTEWVRRRERDAVDSGKRDFKIKGTPGSRGAHAHPVNWTMTSADVIAGGMAGYRENVRAWARSVLGALRASGNLSRR